MAKIADDLENKKTRRWVRWAVLGLAFANLFVWLAVWENSQRSYLEIAFFDVGQGDAALAQLPGGVQILFDGGPDAGVLEKLGRAMPFYDRDIDWVVLSHTDRDHLAGLLGVLENYRVRNIVWSGISDEDAEDAEWQRLVAVEGANVVLAVAGERFNLGGRADCLLEILSPTPAGRSSGKSQNELSVAVKLTYGVRSFLFTGDAAAGADMMRQAGAADVLKVAHHGSKYSTREAFVAGLLPAVAVISAGANNPYGHPSAELLDLLAKYDIKTLRTDLSGDIVFKTDGSLLFLKTEK
jgi:competence protein ComEC